MHLTLRQAARNARRKLFPRRSRLAVGTIFEIAAVYDDVFTKDEQFDTLEGGIGEKLAYVLEYVRSVDGSILDAGCGRGSVLRFMVDNGVNAAELIRPRPEDRALVDHFNADRFSFYRISV